MADLTYKQHNDFYGAFGGGMKLIREGLGVESFGIQSFDLPAGFDRYPEHDHAQSGQEEVYTALSGQASLTVGGEEFALEPGAWARVGPGEKRNITTGSEPARILCIGGTPGKVYEPPEVFTRKGQEERAKEKANA